MIIDTKEYHQIRVTEPIACTKLECINGHNIFSLTFDIQKFETQRNIENRKDTESFSFKKHNLCFGCLPLYL
jgi:hypothetical protein